MTLTAQYVVKSVQTALQDTAGVRWAASELVVYLNDGQRDLILNRPDANAVMSAIVPVAGARQALPVAAMSLIGITGNTNGNRRAIRKVEMSALDAIDRDWQSMTGVAEFVNFMYDQREPGYFYLYPPASGVGGSVDVLYGAYPTDVSAPSGDGKAFSTVSGNLAVSDQWGNALVNYVLGRAYAKDAEYGGNAQLATAYMQAYGDSLRAQLQSSTAVAPTK